MSKQTQNAFIQNEGITNPELVITRGYVVREGGRERKWRESRGFLVRLCLSFGGDAVILVVVLSNCWLVVTFAGHHKMAKILLFIN